MTPAQPAPVVPPLDVERATRHAEDRKGGDLTFTGEWDESTETGNLARAYLALRAENEALREALTAEADKLKPLMRDLTASEATAARLREALEPFSRLEIPKPSPNNAGAYSIRFADIANAKAALEGAKSHG